MLAERDYSTGFVREVFGNLLAVDLEPGVARVVAREVDEDLAVVFGGKLEGQAAGVVLVQLLVFLVSGHIRKIEVRVIGLDVRVGLEQLERFLAAEHFADQLVHALKRRLEVGEIEIDEIA